MRRVSTLLMAIVAACQTPRSPSPPGNTADEAELLGARDRQDVSAMRAHAWAVWRRIQGEWESWPTSDAVLGIEERHFRGLLPVKIRGRVEVETAPIMFAVIFDPVAAAHVARYRLAARSTLQTMAAVPEFPRESITLKPVWFAVHRDRPTPLPMWDGMPTRPDASGNPSRTWQRHVVIDPQAVTAGADHSIDDLVPGTVPIGAFLHRVIATDAEVAAARAVTRDSTLAIGDYLVLVGMHVSTKEIPDWVWATLWWHDRPDDGPYAADRPAALTGAAGHYLMDVAYSADTPREADGSQHVAMNPWLEARFPDGLHSNCVACHQRAAHGAVDYLPVTRGLTPPADPYFTGKTTTDFVWSLALEAR